MQLNPNYSPVFRVPAFLNAYAEGKYVEALDLEVRIKCQDFSTLTPCELQRSGKLMGEETSLRKWCGGPYILAHWIIRLATGLPVNHSEGDALPRAQALRRHLRHAL